MKTIVYLFFVLMLLFSCFFANAGTTKEPELLEVKHGINAHDISYKAYFYGEKCEKEPPIKKYYSDIVKGKYIEGGYLPDEYLINNVTFSHIYPNSQIEENYLETGHFFYFGESYGLFYNASYDRERKWKGRLIKNIVVEFLEK